MVNKGCNYSFEYGRQCVATSLKIRDQTWYILLLEFLSF